MGGTSYSCSARAVRSQSLGYSTTHANDTKVFKQNAERKINEGMDPAQISLREARDSEVHPQVVPIILGLDVTGSMGRIPADLIKGDLPHLMGHLVDEKECPDAALLFIAVGDLYADTAPVQIGQFESGDAELDHWLTTCWLEGNGGGNGGESYSTPWLFALNMVQTDAWDKRQEKGLIITVGDEPIHPEMPKSRLREVFGTQYEAVVEGLECPRDISVAQLLEKVRERWNVHHIQMGETRDKHHGSWHLLGEGYHEVSRNASITDKVREIIKQHMALRKAAPVREEAFAVAGSPEMTELDAPTSGSIPDPI